jgi:tight adherence protein B
VLAVNGSLTLAVPVALLVLTAGLAGDARLVRPRRLSHSRPGGPSNRTGPSAAGPAHRRARRSLVRLVRSHRRERRPTDQQVADWCDALARRVRTGDSLVSALRTVEAPPTIDAAVTPARLALDRGAGAATAIMAARHRSTGLDAAVGVISACATLGGPAAEPLDRVAATMRRRVADAADRHAQSAQARLSALILTVLPGAVLAVLAATSSAVRSGLGTTAVVISVSAGALLNLIGWWWMRTTIGAAS